MTAGAVLGGKYRVGEVIGEGGVGLVIAADHLELGERVALKFLKEDVSKDEAIVARFLREAKAAVRIKSEHVARVLDVAKTDHGVPYLVMELLEGRDLQREVEARGGLPIKEAVEYVMQTCEALAYAHALGIVHRDIKPENLFLTERGQGMRMVKVLDFGISKAALTGASIFGSNVPLVRTQNLMGTPLYMAPEQIRNAEECDARVDIWALGMTLFELLTGTTAFMASSLTELSAAILEREPAPIEQFRQDIPAGLSDTIYRCLEKNRDDRYPNMAELAAALMPYGPKRARVNVERASSVLQAAGVIKHAVSMASELPPAPHEPSRVAIPTPPALPRLSRPDLQTGSQPGLGMTPSQSEAAVTPAPEKKGFDGWPFVAGGIVLASVVAVLLAAQLRRPPAAPPPPPIITTVFVTSPMTAPPPPTHTLPFATPVGSAALVPGSTVHNVPSTAMSTVRGNGPSGEKSANTSPSTSPASSVTETVDAAATLPPPPPPHPSAPHVETSGDPDLGY